MHETQFDLIRRLVVIVDGLNEKTQSTLRLANVEIGILVHCLLIQEVVVELEVAVAMRAFGLQLPLVGNINILETDSIRFGHWAIPFDKE